MRKKWTDADIDILKVNYRWEESVEILSQVLERTPQSIKQKASRLGLKIRDGRAKVRNHHGKDYWYRVIDRKPVMIHTLLMEKKLGRKLRKNEVIHHVDGNGLNNSWSNLELHTRGSHMKEHDPFRERNIKGQYM